MSALIDGQFGETTGRPSVRFERSYRHPVKQVWEAVTSPQGLAAWFPSPVVEYTPRVGATITLSGDPYAPEGSTGLVLAWEPGRMFGFEWGPNQLFLTVSADGGFTRFELLDLLDNPGSAARNAAGWDLCLAALADHLDGRGPTPNGGLAAFLPVLERYKANGLPDDGWLPDPV